MTNRAIVDITRGITKNLTPSVGSGIFYSPSLGLISISDDGENWITITDKNLGANTVYNYGDVLTNDNGGNYYQWGNNHGFPGPDSSSVTPKSTVQVDASGYGPGNYYDDGTFIYSNTFWSSTMNTDLWGYDTWTVSGAVEAKQGPCPNGFHVADRDEFIDLSYKLFHIGISSIRTDRIKYEYGKYLFIPPLGGRISTSAGSIRSLNENIWLWTSMFRGVVGSEEAYYFFNGETSPGMRRAGADGLPIRPFKNEPVIPDGSWLPLWLNDMRGIYHNATLGLISLSINGIDWVTISDKNLGATQVYNSGDAFSESNCGKMYQRGNNYGFPYDFAGVELSTTQVDATGYGPGNYYNSNILIYRVNDWSSVRNDNLWGDVSDTDSARQGPCPVGFHVPSSKDLDDFMYCLDSFSGLLDKSDICQQYLHIPLSGYVTSYGYSVDEGSKLYFWSSANHSGDYNYSYFATQDSVGYGPRADIRHIRPFKNESVIPDSSWTKLY